MLLRSVFASPRLFARLSFAPFSKQSQNKAPLDPTKYYQNRVTLLSTINKYPYGFRPNISVAAFLAKYSTFETTSSQNLVKVAGRITSIRKHGKLNFLDITQESLRLQIVTSSLPQYIRRGDIVGVEGSPFKTQKGELSVKANQITMLAPCLHMLPESNNLKDLETRYRKRYLDMLVNTASVAKIKTRSKIISSLRQQLVALDFIEVETPSLAPNAGGAIAKPFETYLHELDMKLYMRIAPELYLKKLLVGGLDRVFEIGKNFRNQGMDQTHNPEFTSCELYTSYWDYNDMITFTEQLLSKIVVSVTGRSDIVLTDKQGEKRIISLKRPWKKISLVAGLQQILKVNFPPQFDSEQSRLFLDNLCKQKNVECSEPRSSSRLLDKLAGQFIEPMSLEQPIFIVDHPKVMSPLAKTHPNNPHLSQRFELFLNGWEVVNSYTELNDPIQQLKNCPEDKEYVQALQYGLVPCAGWGIGLDRLVMLLTDSSAIQEIIIFPLLKNVNKQSGQQDHGNKNL